MSGYLSLLIPVIVILVLSYLIGVNKEGVLPVGWEHFMNLDELETPLVINNSCNWKKSDDCEGDIPLINSSCNKVPNFPGGLEPKPTELNQDESFNQPFHRLADKEGRFTFKIPELKYDGIYSKSVRNNECCWSLKSKNIPNTYGADNFLHVPLNLHGRTIIEPPECQGLAPGFAPCVYRNDCQENKPCRSQQVSFRIE